MAGQHWERKQVDPVLGGAGEPVHSARADRAGPLPPEARLSDSLMKLVRVASLSYSMPKVVHFAYLQTIHASTESWKSPRCYKRYVPTSAVFGC